MRMGLSEGSRWITFPQSGDLLCTFEAWSEPRSPARGAAAASSLPMKAAAGFRGVADAVTGPPTAAASGPGADNLSAAPSPVEKALPPLGNGAVPPRQPPHLGAVPLGRAIGVQNDDDVRRTSGRFALYLLSAHHCSVPLSNNLDITNPSAENTTSLHGHTAVTDIIGDRDQNLANDGTVGAKGIVTRRATSTPVAVPQLQFGPELAGSEIRGRVLRRRGFAGVLVVRVAEWEQLGGQAERDAALRQAVTACLEIKKPEVLGPKPVRMSMESKQGHLSLQRFNNNDGTPLRVDK